MKDKPTLRRKLEACMFDPEGDTQIFIDMKAIKVELPEHLRPMAAVTSLLPCPFCGRSGAIMVEQDDVWMVRCDGNLTDECGAWVGGDSEDQAINNWNQRAAPSEQTVPKMSNWWPMEVVFRHERPRELEVTVTTEAAKRVGVADGAVIVADFGGGDRDYKVISAEPVDNGVRCILINWTGATQSTS